MSAKSREAEREAIRAQLATPEGKRALVGEVREDLLLFYRLMKKTAAGEDDEVEPQVLAQRRLAAGMAKDLAELLLEALKEE